MHQHPQDIWEATSTMSVCLQVVAGTNYKLFLDVANSANKMEHVEATVYGMPIDDACVLCSLPCRVGSCAASSSCLLCVAAPLGNQEMQLTGHRTPKPDEVN